MSEDEVIYKTVGKVKDAHGLKGELYITLFAKEAGWLKQMKTLRIKATEAADSQEFAVKNARLHKGGLIVTTQEIRDRNQSETFKGYLFEIPATFLISKKGEAIYLKEIEGFKVSFEGNSEVAVVKDFGTNGAQDLLILQLDRGEFEVPFVEAFVKQINYADKTIHLALPPGLLGEFEEEDQAQ